MKTLKNSRAALTIFALFFLFIAGITLAAVFLETSNIGAKSVSVVSSTNLNKGISKQDILQILTNARIETTRGVILGAVSQNNASEFFLSLANSLLLNYTNKIGITNRIISIEKKTESNISVTQQGIQNVLNYGNYSITIKTS